MNRHFSHFLQLGLAITVMSSSGSLGRYISLPPPVTIWLRSIIGVAALFIVLKLLKVNMRIWSGNSRMLLISSLSLALHWITYFFALHYSTVALGMLSMFTYPVVTALLEPLMLKTRFQPTALILAGMAFTGIALLVPELSFENNYTIGILFGIVSSVFYSIRNIMLKMKVGEHSGIALMFYQVLIISIVLSPVVFFYDISWQQFISTFWKPLLLLGLLTTATGHTLYVMSFRYFNITTVSIISSLTPLLGSILGFIFLSEMPSERTFIGGSVILLTVVAESIRTRFSKSSS